MKRPIGVFDSGVGGLTVLRALKKLLPHENFVYFGDTARIPYGNKSPETIRRYSLENAEFLLHHNVKLIIIACNTATAHALETLRQQISVPVMGVIEPGAEEAVRVTKSGHIGILATRGTIDSGVYEREIMKRLPSAKIQSRATPLFVPLVEEGIVEPQILYPIFDYYLKDLCVSGVSANAEEHSVCDTLVLGCTHYPLLKKHLQNYLSQLNLQRPIELLDSADVTARATLKNYPDLIELDPSDAVALGTIELHFSDDTQNQRMIAERILQSD